MGVAGGAAGAGGSSGAVSSGGSSGEATGGAVTGGGAGSAGMAGGAAGMGPEPRRRLSLGDGWRFKKGDPPGVATNLAYSNATVKSFVLPTGNALVSNPADRATRPQGNLGDGVAYVAVDFDDSTWQAVNVPHDYAIAGPYTNSVSGSMGHLPATGVAWYRKAFTVPATDAGKSVFLDLDGAMSFSLVWLNGQFVGGWPYGYSSYRLDLTPYLKPGDENVIAVRLDNPVPADSVWSSGSSRWYPGAGIYRNVWLVTTSPVRVGQWGTQLTTPAVTRASATVDLKVTIDNASDAAASVSVATTLFELDAAGNRTSVTAGSLAPVTFDVPAGASATATTTGALANPKLWGVGPNEQHRYVAVTTVTQGGEVVDVYETPFGVRTLRYDPNQGFFLNGAHVKLNGVCNHHDLGALGAAVNVRALERQLEIMKEMGVNAIRTAHNPPTPELLELTDRMGFLVMDEAFDVWVRQKTVSDYHVVFPDWHEQDLRAMLRRDRNHPSVIMWSVGNEIVEQSNDGEGVPLGQELVAICKAEDPTRPTIQGMNSAAATSSFPDPMDLVGLNYQGTGVRSGPAQYPVFHQNFPDKVVLGTETVAALSSRGVYLFPVASGNGVPSSPAAGEGEDAATRQVSSYDLYFADWSYFPDKEFDSQERYPYVAGEFVWTGFDYLGEPTPFDASRSSYFGIVDLAGFKKDRFYLYQARWRPDFPMVHIVPHWTWPERNDQVTPVHVYTSGDEAELFLNGTSLGRKQKGQYQYRLRWDDVRYAAGELGVVAYKDGVEWATASVTTATAATKVLLTADRVTIAADGKDLSFITAKVADAENRMAPRAMNLIHFELTGPGEIVATDNGDPTDTTVFSSTDRKAFNGLALAIVRTRPGQPGTIVVTARADGLTEASVMLSAQ
jgi:beta-galactosidase